MFIRISCSIFKKLLQGFKQEENYMNPLEYRHFVICIFPMVMDMLSALDQIWVKLDNETYNERITKTKKNT